MKSKRQNQVTSPAASPPSDSEQSAKEADRFLPIANVSRIMKRSLPANAKISKEAKEAVQACVSEFISFVTGEASDKCQREKRKTVNGEDLLWAMTTLGFENYVSPLNLYLSRYREAEGGGDHKGGGAATAGSGGRQGDHQSPVEDLRHEPRPGFSSGFDVSPGIYGAAPAAAAPPVASLGLGIGGGAGGGGFVGYGVQPMMGGGGGDVNGGGGWSLPNHVHGVQWY